MLFEKVTRQRSGLQDDLIISGYTLAYATMVLVLKADRLDLRPQDRWTVAQYLVTKEQRRWVKLGRVVQVEMVRACVPASWGALYEVWEGVGAEVVVERLMRADMNIGMRY